jgi:nucleoside-triphosphatase THEP1
MKNAIINIDVIVCDEIGPKEFIDAANNLLRTDKKVIVVIHQKLKHSLIIEFREKAGSLININIGNREKVGKSNRCYEYVFWSRPFS